ncbi:hypothetical protein [Arthrobacter sp. fls2-241-R2A-172]|uniref:hypothetical protein n=1 Tax=Arthrobacter sp. fls2-241-R2A-172 TaxID=3040325 RepID=UPI0025512DB5|nr:hypothetical protein [Arthrobacter sp. fls2-241-R2A-172]
MRVRMVQDRDTQNSRLLPQRYRLQLAVLCTLIAVILGTIGISNSLAPEHQGEGIETVQAKPQASPGPKVPAPNYPISGFFISASSRDTANFKKLSDIKKFGGDTVITFGTPLKQTPLDSVPGGCLINGTNCARVAAGALSVERYFTYLDGSNWNSSALKCPNDRRVTTKGESYVVLVLPNAGQGCTSTNGKYDVVIVGGGSSSATDPSSSLASAATKLGMKFFAGLPAPAKRTDLAYLPDVSYEATLMRFTDRFLQYQAAANDVPGLTGFYHHTEMPLTDSKVFESVLSIYTSQNRAIHRILPTRQAIISPYIDARVGKPGTSVDDARNGARRIAQTSAGVRLSIAIQDGMGTGKGGAFTIREATSPVDAFAASIVGKGTWGQKYIAPNRDYFLAAAAGIKGTGAVLWANVEGMAPATKFNPCGDSFRGQTTKARIDRQLQQVANAQKVVSFMWDSYFTCEGTGTPLISQVESGLTTPIVTDSTFRPETGQVQIVGFNLQGGEVSVKWATSKGTPNEKTVVVSSVNRAYGLENGMNPKLEMINVTVGPTSVDASKNYSLRVTNEWGAHATEFAARVT